MDKQVKLMHQHVCLYQCSILVLKHGTASPQALGQVIEQTTGEVFVCLI